LTDQPHLKRGLNLTLMTLYGLGTTIGAGIYVLIGKVAGSAGLYAPLSFVLASVLVAFSAFSFAELSSRMPRSAGEAVYIREGFRSEWLAVGVGILVILAGLVSAAAIPRGFVGYFQVLVDLPGWFCIVIIVFFLGAVAAWGITESVSLAAFITVVEAAGLIFVVWVARDSFAALPETWQTLPAASASATWIGVFSGVVVAFYAFIGFEDMVNVAEEVKDVRRTLPRAIVLTLLATAGLYFLVGLVAVLAVPVPELAESGAPLALIVERTGGMSGQWISLIAVIAVLNGAFIQIIMASRVLYGLSQQGWLPAVFATIHPKRRTPVYATVTVSMVALVFALVMPLETLARATSLITLAIFATVNLALWRIKGRGPAPGGAVEYPRWVSLCGFVACSAVFLAELVRLSF